MIHKLLITTLLIGCILIFCGFIYVFPQHIVYMNGYPATVDEAPMIKTAKEPVVQAPDITEPATPGDPVDPGDPADLAVPAEPGDPGEHQGEDSPTTTITISVAGDCTLGSDERRDYVYSFMHEFERQGRDYGFFFAKVQHIFAASDLSLVNLEGPLTNAVEHEDKPFVFRGPPEFARILAAGNIDAVNLANNHTFDYLEQGYRDTLQALRSAGIGYFGNEKNYTTEISGITVTLLGFTKWEARWSEEWILAQIREANKTADLVIVSFHWGDEYSYLTTELQRTMGRLAIDSGADLVWGHHPHVLQGIEYYQDRYIVYSLGNLSFGGNRNPEDRDTMIFQQIFEFTGHTLTGLDYKIIPCSISSIEGRNNFQPVPLTGEEADRVIFKVLGL